MAERKKIRLSLQEVQPGMAVAEPICLEGEKKYTTAAMTRQHSSLPQVFQKSCS